MQKRRVAGFTMIELLVVATIIIVLSMIGMTSYRVATRTARNGRRAADMEQVRAALEIYRVESANRTYPQVASWAQLMSSLTNYLDNTNISDPKNDVLYTYTYTSLNSGRSYSLCYKEEPGNNNVCLSNP